VIAAQRVSEKLDSYFRGIYEMDFPEDAHTIGTMEVNVPLEPF